GSRRCTALLWRAARRAASPKERRTRWPNDAGAACWARRAGAPTSANTVMAAATRRKAKIRLLGIISMNGSLAPFSLREPGEWRGDRVQNFVEHLLIGLVRGCLEQIAMVAPERVHEQHRAQHARGDGGI